MINPLTVIVTVAALLVYFWTGLMVGRARGVHGIVAPAMTGHPEFERSVRVQYNTLEWLVIFVPSLWMFAALVNEMVAVAAGVVWIGARIVYALAYVKDPAKRGPAFGVQALATGVLLFGSLGGAVWSMVNGG